MSLLLFLLGLHHMRNSEGVKRGGGERGGGERGG